MLTREDFLDKPDTVKFFIEPKEGADVDSLVQALLQTYTDMFFMVYNKNAAYISRTDMPVKNAIIGYAASKDSFEQTFGGELYQEEENLSEYFDNSVPHMIKVWKEKTAPTIPEQFQDQMKHLSIHPVYP